MSTSISALGNLSMPSHHHQYGTSGSSISHNDALQQYDHLVTQSHQHPFSSGFQAFNGQNFSNSMHSFHQGIVQFNTYNYNNGN